MIAKTRPPSCHALLCFALWYCSVALVVVRGETNLFRGFKQNDGVVDDIPYTTTLSNGVTLPLVGLGVGNQHKNLVENMIHQCLKDDNRIRLIDTAHASGNEQEVAKGIIAGVQNLKEQVKNDKGRNKQIDGKKRIQVHVVTKIWYTYLGYERTKIAIQEILHDLDEASKDPSVDLKITLLLHWPQCYDDIAWMDCEGEEKQLPDRIKNAGPPPHLDRENAWKGSWKAMEEAYEDEQSNVASIGISNFGYRTLQELLQTSKMAPHMAQINVWSLVNDPALIELMKEHNIHLQVYNVMNGIISQVYDNPKAHHHILMVGNQLDREKDTTVERVLFGQVILRWLVQEDISVIPRTSDPEHLAENCAVQLSQIAEMSAKQADITFKSIKAIINNVDLARDVSVQVRFHAKESDMFLYWVPEEGNTEKQLAFIEKGSSYLENTHPGHTFKVYHAYNPDQFETLTVRGHYGESQDIHFEL